MESGVKGEEVSRRDGEWSSGDEEWSSGEGCE